MKLYKRILSYLSPHLPWLFLALALNIIFAVSNVLFIPLIRDITQEIATKNLKYFNNQIINALILYLVRLFSIYGQTYVMAYVGNRIIIDMRMQLYMHLNKLSMDFFSKWRLGEIVSRVFNDINNVQNAVLTNFTTIIPQVLTLIGVTGYLIYLNWRLTIVALVAIPIFIIIVMSFAKKLRELSGQLSQKTADIIHVFQETMAGIRVVQSFTMESHEIKKFLKENEKNFQMNMKGVRISALQEPITSLLQFVAVATLVWYGGYEVAKGHLSGPNLVSFFTGIALLIDPVIALSRIYTATQQSFASAERVFAILDIEPTIKDKKNAMVLQDIKGQIEFRNVSFSYDVKEKKALKNINIKVNPGEIIALVGPSGAGKSTFVNLIMRFYDPVEGQIFLDGYDLRDISIVSLREKMGVVPQETLLFSTDIKENIKYGKVDATDEEITNAAKVANAHEFIENLKDKYETLVGERGIRLSGGQRQRISIARAILRDPKILILDEATSSLDIQSERLVQNALERLMKGRTTFVIAHRLSTVLFSDRILVFDDGEIIESGKHEELIERSGLYKKLYDMQFVYKKSSS